MHKKLIYTLIFASISIFSVACTETGAVTSKASTPNKSAFSFPIANAANYWYQGKAELSTYDVEQERYGEMRKAEQVNIFVTEDFSKSKQVKLDDAAAAGVALPTLGELLGTGSLDAFLGETDDLDEETESFDFGWTAGVGADMGRVTLDARYTMGLMNIDKTGDDTIKNRTFSVMVGFRLK